MLRIEGGGLLSETIRNIFSFYHNIEVGLYSYGGDSSHRIMLLSERKLADIVLLPRQIYIFGGNHPLKSISLHPYFYNPIFGYVDKLLISRKGPVIGNDVWIGHHAIILPSVSEIGHGAVIGAGSLVTKDVPPFAIYAGNPARLIRYRFSEKIVEELLKSQWWDRDIKELFEDIRERLYEIHPTKRRLEHRRIESKYVLIISFHASNGICRFKENLLQLFPIKFRTSE